MTDIAKAQEGWNKTREGRWEVADQAADLPTEYGSEAAKKFGQSLKPSISDDSVYRLARAGRMYAEIEKYHPKTAAYLRKCLSDNYFDAVGKHRLYPSDAIERLGEAIENNWNIERFRAEISDSDGNPTNWTKVSKYVTKYCIKTPALGMGKHYDKISRAGKLLLRRIENWQEENK